MRKAFRHTGVLMMLAVVALGLVGAAYTLWWEELELHATASTGTFNIDWSNAVAAHGVVCLTQSDHVNSTTGESSDCATPASFTPGNKDDRSQSKLPTCSSVIGTKNTSGELPGFPPLGNDMANDAADNNTLEIIMTNLYPFAGCKMQVDISNKGTVPAHLTVEVYAVVGGCPGGCPSTALITGLSATSTPVGGLYLGPANHKTQICKLLGDAIGMKYGLGVPGPGQQLTGGAGGAGYSSTNPIDQGDFATNADPVQLHPGESINCEIVVYATELAKEGQSRVRVEMEIIGHQWNERVVLGSIYNPH